MTWRRLAPWLIIVIGVLAIYVDLPRRTLGLENLPVPAIGGEARTVLGLDLQGGIRVTLGVKAQPGQTVTPDQVDSARNIIDQRVAGIGVSEPQVYTEVSSSGEQRIVVEVPGVSNEQEVRTLVGATGLLQFIDPKSQTLQVGEDITKMVQDGTVGVIFDGSGIVPGSVQPDSQSGQLGVSFNLNSTASAAWCTYTTAHGSGSDPGPVALDGKIITTPIIQQPICGGSTIITVGSGTAAEQQRTQLYNQLRYGALPVALQEEGVDKVAATLGRGFLAQALAAGGIGLFLVLMFMIAYYRLPGVLAALALIFYTLVNYAVFREMPVTLTLAGVAAFILSIGMAVDANILIFERMKEEIRAGKTLGPAIEAGFNRAWSSILDSNVSSLLIAAWLYWQGTTVVRGFALVLIIGVLISMFSAVTVTRTMLRWVVRREWGRRIELYHVER
jgi:protein-export membrane protein SecD